jgi:hypothetical protein
MRHAPRLALCVMIQAASIEDRALRLGHRAGHRALREEARPRRASVTMRVLGRVAQAVRARP